MINKFFYHKLKKISVMAQQVVLSEVLNLIKSGYVRYTSQESETGKSVQTFYGLNTAQAKKLFKHPLLKNKRTVDHDIDIIDDLTTTTTAENNVQSVIESISPINDSGNIMGTSIESTIVDELVENAEEELEEVSDEVDNLIQNDPLFN